MTFYRFLVLIHVFSAILGMGPGFILTFIIKKADNMTDLRHSYRLRTKIHIFVMIGGTLLLVSGITMGLLNPFLFEQLWYSISLGLFLIALAFGPLILKPLSVPIKKILEDKTITEIPNEYHAHEKKLVFYEKIENIIFLVIIAFMILKPVDLESFLHLFGL